MPGTNTSASNTTPPRKIQGASFCQPFIGTWNVTSAATAPAARNVACRARKYHDRNPAWADASAIAIDDE